MILKNEEIEKMSREELVNKLKAVMCALNSLDMTGEEMQKLKDDILENGDTADYVAGYIDATGEMIDLYNCAVCRAVREN